MTPSSFHPSEVLPKVCLVMCPSNRGTALVTLPLSYDRIQIRDHPGDRPRHTSIHVLDDDSILNIFHFCRPVLLDRAVFDDHDVLMGGEWVRECWWYDLAHVCRRWRCIVLGSSSRLRLCLLLKYNTPVADMLAHSPPLPLVIDYWRMGAMGFEPSRMVEIEEGILLALQHRNRIRRIRIIWPLPSLQKFTMSMDEEFPILEYLYVAPGPPVESNMTQSLVLPHTFQAPHLRYLILTGFAFPTGHPLFPTAVGVVTLSLRKILSDANFRLSDLFHLLSLLPQLESLTIGFHSPFTNRDVEKQLSIMSNMKRLRLPNLRHFAFEGVSTYLEMILPRVTAPRLRRLRISSFNQLSFYAPCLRAFMSRARNLHFRTATVMFSRSGVRISLHNCKTCHRMCTFSMDVVCSPPDWQVSFVAQIFTVLGPLFPEVVDLTLGYSAQLPFLEWDREAERTEWHALLGSFHNVKTLRLFNGRFTKEIFRSLRPADGESSVDILPELKNFDYYTSGASDTFFDTLLVTRRPVMLAAVCRPS